MFVLCNEKTRFPIKIWLEDESRLEGIPSVSASVLT